MKKYKWQIIISLVLILLPAVFLLCFADQLPAQMALHWGLDGKADGYGSPWFLCLLPLVMVALQILFLWLHFRDRRNREQNERVTAITFWILPLIEYFALGVTFMTATGKEMNVSFFSCLLFAVLFFVMGNYMPKVRQNSTFGIKVVWTYSSEENWNATHRLAGKVWVAGGAVILFAAFLPEFWGLVAMFAVLIPMVAIPTVYSYHFYKKEMAEGKITGESKEGTPDHKANSKIALIISAVAIALVCLLMLVGEVKVEFGEDSFTAKATMWTNLTVEYDAIEEVEFRESLNRGSRMNGVGSTRLLAGIFHNEEFGSYHLYSYTKCEAAVVVKVQGKILVISGENVEATRQIYQQLLSKMGEG